MGSHNRLSAAFLRNAPPGKHCDGAGLWYVKRADGGSQWVLRVTVHGKRREMGLGSGDNVSLADARSAAKRWRSEAAAGRDPIKLRETQKREANRTDTRLAVITSAAFEARKAELKGDGKNGRWLSPLQTHVLPKLGQVPIEELDQRDIRDTLEPIWHSKAGTAQKALNRIRIVFRYAAALDLSVDLQAPDKAKALLGRSRHQVKHIAAMEWQSVPAFYKSLEPPSTKLLALRFLILTGMRSRAVRRLHFDQLASDVWTVPAENMKGPKGRTSDFCVPLSTEAQRVIEAARPFARDGFLFPGPRRAVLSDKALPDYMTDRGLKARPHGFRTSLRNWLADTTDASHEVAETIIGHVAGSPVVRAYRRTDYLEPRRILMERWSNYLLGHDSKAVRLVVSS